MNIGVQNIALECGNMLPAHSCVCNTEEETGMMFLRQLYLFLLHPWCIFQDHYYRCRRCGLQSAIAEDLCDPEKFKFSDYDYGD